MSERVFLDTNVLVYADDADAGAKRIRAQELIHATFADGSAVLSTQVLQEFFVVSTRKLGVAPDIARRKVELLARADVVLVRPHLILGAIDLLRLHSPSFWDALIVKCASAAGCARVLSEDMGDGAVYDGLRIENPFK